MMTPGDLRYIKRHTKKSLEKYYESKGVKMKPTKKRPAKKTDNPIIGKLLKLKYRINNTASEEGGWSADLQESNI